MIELHHGDCLDILPTLAADSADAVVTDPPYGLKFMGKDWDHGVPGVPFWRAALRVLKPGGYMLAFGGTRTYHRLVCSIEDAGFEIRDCLMWLYGSGFPKGKGCLKPSWEPIVLARKPGKRVLPLGIEECKVRIAPEAPECRWPPNLLLQHSDLCGESCDESCVVRALGEQSGERKSGDPRKKDGTRSQKMSEGWDHPWRHREQRIEPTQAYGDTGTAARFYPQFKYCSKASRRDRNEGCEGMEPVQNKSTSTHGNGCGTTRMANQHERARGLTHVEMKTTLNSHPTVKPTALMEWLVRLACPEGGTVLDPFMGSGSTGKACMRAGRRFVGIERDAEWLPIARARIEHEQSKLPLFAGAEPE